MLRADLAVLPTGTTAAGLLAIDVKHLESLGLPFVHLICNETERLGLDLWLLWLRPDMAYDQF